MSRASEDPALEMEWIQRTHREMDKWVRDTTGASMRQFQDYVLDRERIATLEGQFVEATKENGELRSRLAFVEAENGRLRAAPAAGGGRGGVGTLAIATNELIECNRIQGVRIAELEAELLAKRDAGSQSGAELAKCDAGRIAELEAELAKRDAGSQSGAELAKRDAGSQSGAELAKCDAGSQSAAERIAELEAEVARLSAPGSFVEKMTASQSLMESLQKSLADAMSTGASRAEIEAAKLEAVEAVKRADASAKELEAAKLEAVEAVKRADASAKELEEARREAVEAVQRADASAKELEAAKREAGEAVKRADASAKELKAAKLEAVKRADASAKELEEARREAEEAVKRADASAKNLEAARTTMNDLEKKVQSVGKGVGEVKSLNTKLKKAEGDIRVLTKKNASISKDLEELQADMETITKVKTKEVRELKAQVADLEGKIQTLEGGVSLWDQERDGLKRKAAEISKELVAEKEKRRAVKKRADKSDAEGYARRRDREALGGILALAKAVLDGGCAAETIRSATDAIAKTAEDSDRAASLLVRDSDGEESGRE